MSKDGDFKAFVSSESASQLIISALKSIGNGIELSSQAVYYVGNLFADAARQRQAKVLYSFPKEAQHMHIA